MLAVLTDTDLPHPVDSVLLPLMSRSFQLCLMLCSQAHLTVEIVMLEKLDCILSTSTGGGFAAPRVAKPDGVVDGIFP